MTVSNEQFLKAIFGDKYKSVHVTSFMDDPSDITHGESGRCWVGGHYGETPLIPKSNQYFTVSLFDDDELGRANRRKANFSACFVVGLDDVREKMPIEQVMRLPPPSIVLKSSLGSEQWLYALQTPETNPSRIDNLHDGLIASDLVPSGKDTGMKGTTRYLRLPDGCNTKASRIAENRGVAPQCEITEWHPERRYTLEQIAAPFDVDVDAPRADKRTGGAVEMPDHPLLHTPALKVKRQRGGTVEITCPWVDEHTGQDDSGTAMFTNSDDIGFKCHHGNCEGRTATDLLDYIEEHDIGFKERLKQWQAAQAFSAVSPASAVGVAPQVALTGRELMDAMAIDGDEILKNAKKQVYVMRGVAARGQWTTIFAPTGAGKTLLTLWLLLEGVQDDRVKGSDVYYVNIDDDPVNSAVKASMIKSSGLKMLVGGMEGCNTDEVVALMRQATVDGSADGMIIVIDTLKKIADIQHKTKAAAFGTVAREFTVAGGTLIALAHTNKYTDEDGKHVHSGTSDIPQDCDATRMLEPVLKTIVGDTVTHVVQFEGGKVRGRARKDVTFEYVQKLEDEEDEVYDPNESDEHDGGLDYREMFDSVKRLTGAEAKAVSESAVLARRKKEDAEAISAVTDVLTNADVVGTAKMEIVKRVTEHHGVPRRVAVAVLDRYEGSLWLMSRGERGAMTYSLNLPPDPPPVSFL